MRFRPFMLTLLVAGAVASGPAMSAPIPAKLRKSQSAPVAAPADTASGAAASTDGLRGSLSAQGAPSGDAPVSPLSLSAPATRVAALNSPGPATSPAISPLRSVGDPAPLCRSQCAETRYTCAASDDTQCDAKWSQCVADCSAADLR